MLLGEWLETWKNLYLEPSSLAESTKAMYARAIYAISVRLGSHDLATLSALDIQAMLVSIAREYPRAAQLDRITLARSLKVAAKLGLCPPGIIDPDTVPKPAHKPQETRTYSLAEARRYVEAIRPMHCRLLLLLCLVCGLRRGEALGLRREDVDASAGTLTISRQRLRIRGTYAAAPLKSAAAHRCLALPSELVALISAQPRTLSGYVIDATPERLRQDHLAAIRAAELPPITIHGLRHTMATLAAEAGMPIKLLQVSLGHATYKLTADLYANHHLPPSTAPTLVFQGLRVV